VVLENLALRHQLVVHKRTATLPDYLVLLVTVGGLAVFGVSGFAIGLVVAVFFLIV
jgi:predicted PurR-regulated permease PerM